MCKRERGRNERNERNEWWWLRMKSGMPEKGGAMRLKSRPVKTEDEEDRNKRRSN